LGSESVKGSLVLGAAIATRRMVERGRVSREIVDVRLSASALELIDHKIEVARWYPIGPFCELIELAWEVEGDRKPSYLERQGAISADHLFDSNRYQQLDFAQRSGKAESKKQLLRQARLIATVTGTFYNFLEVDVGSGEDGLDIYYRNAEAFLDPLIHTTVGFMNQVNVRQGSKRRWTGERTSSIEVRFHMVLPKRLMESE
jgi:hypothetical protein